MAECHDSNRTGFSRGLYPALAIAALTGFAITYFVMKKQKDSDDTLGVDKVVNICNSAASKLEAFVTEALAS